MKNSNWLITIPLLFLFLFYILPLLNVFSYLGEFPRLISILSNPLNLSYIRFTFYQAILSTILALLIGFPGAYLFGRYKLPFHRFWKSIFTVPFVIPPIVVVVGFILTFGPYGILNMLLMQILQTNQPVIEIYNTFEGILLAHVFYNAPVAIRLIGTAWEALDAEQEQVARTLGVSKWRIFWHINLPQLVPSIVTSGILIFLYCFSSFGIPLSLGGVKYKTLEVQIYRRARMLDFTTAAALALFQILVTALITLPYFVFSEKRKGLLKREVFFQKEPLFTRKNTWKAITSLIYFFVLVLVLVLPLASIYLRSILVNNTISLDNYAKLLSNRYLTDIGTSIIKQFQFSLLFAFSAAIIALLLGIITILVSRSFKTQLYPNMLTKLFTSATSLLILLPMVTSGVIYALGLIIAYSNTPLLNELVWLTIIIAQVLIAYPFVTRTLDAAINEVSPEFRDVSRSLGKSNFITFFKIELPQILPSVLVAFTFAFAIALGEFGATNFLARRDFSTLTVGIYNFITKRELGTAAAMASVLILFCAISFYIIDKFGDISL